MTSVLPFSGYDHLVPAEESRQQSSNTPEMECSLPFSGVSHISALTTTGGGKKRKATTSLPFSGFQSMEAMDDDDDINDDHTHDSIPAAVRPVPETKAFEEMCAAYVRDRSNPITPEKQHAILSYEQHLASGEANPRWLAARDGNITGSITGGIHGLNPYSSWEKVLANMLWPSFVPNAACRWGNEKEDTAQASYEEWWGSLVGTRVERSAYPDGSPAPWWAGHTLVESRVENMGLVIDRATPWRGMSPDGVNRLLWDVSDSRQPPAAATRDASRLPETILVEYKCPYRQRNQRSLTRAHLYPLKSMPLSGKRMPCPAYYYCQVHHGMSVLGEDFLTRKHLRTDFVVWAPAMPASAAAPPPPPRRSAFADPGEGGLLLGGLLAESYAATPAASVTGGRSLVANPPTPFVVRDFTPEAPFSRNIATSHGLIELTEIDNDPEFSAQLSRSLHDFWHDKYVPARVLRDLGCLHKGDIAPPIRFED